MKPSSTSRMRLAQILLGAAIVISLVLVRGAKAGNEPAHLTNDWSHRHVVFSAPRNTAEKVRLMSNPRYAQQQLRRSALQQNNDISRWRHASDKPHSLQGDWNQYLGYNGVPTATGLAPATAGADNYPAKYSFSTTSATCAGVSAPALPDFVVYGTSLAGSGAGIQGVNTLTVSSVPTSGTITVFNTNTGRGMVLSEGSSNSNSGTGVGTFNTVGDSTTTQVATDIATAINVSGNGSNAGISATSAGNVVTVATTAVGNLGNYYSFTGGSGLAWTFEFFQDDGTGIPSIMAFDNLYTSCSGTVPTSFWSFNTGGQVLTSPTLSGDGTQVAYVQNAGGSSSLVILRWAANDGINPNTNPYGGGANFPVTLTSQSPASDYPGCTAPCMLTIPFFGTAATNTHSSPFYDFAHDVLYVGDDNGFLHKFTGVFMGIPAEVVSSGADVWPASVNPSTVLTSAVLEDGAGVLFVADSAGILHQVDATIGSGSGGVVSSGTLGTSGIQDSPMLDATTGDVYVFVQGDDGVGALQRTGVFQFGSGFTSGSTGVEAVVSSNNTLPATGFYAGDFDNAYYNSLSATGNLYVCSTNGSGNAVWQIPIAAGVMGTPVAGPALTSANVPCSPVTEFFNPTITSVSDPSGTDSIFLGVTGSATGVLNCPSASTGCLVAYNITLSTGWSTATVSAAAPVSGGTSGLVVDGSSSVGGASQVYFSPLGNGNCTSNGNGIGGCAIQASQSGLD